MARSQATFLDSLSPTELSLPARVLTSFRYWWWLALCAFLIGGGTCFLGSRYLAQCFQSSVVIGFPVVEQAAGAIGSSPSQAVLGAIDQAPAIEGLVQKYGPEPALIAIARLGSWTRRVFLHAQLAFDPIATTVPNSVALRILAKEKTPEAASALAVAVGQAVLDQAEARLVPDSSHVPPVSTPSPAPAELAPSQPDTSTPPPVQPPSPLPPRKTVTWKTAPETPEVTRHRMQLTDQLVNEQERRSRLQNDLTALNAMPKVQVPPPLNVRSSNEALLKSQLNAANNTLIALQNRYTDQHPDVIAAHQRVRDLQIALEEAIAKNAIIAKQNAMIAAKTAEAHERLARQSDLQTQIVELNARIAGDSAALNALSKEKTWIPVVHYSTPDQPAPVQSAPAPPPVPVAPPSPVIPSVPQVQHFTLTPTAPVPAMFVAQPILAALSVLFGVLLAVLLVSIAELTNRSVKDAESLEAELPYGVLYMGEIPRMVR
jgi:hypothetical protein